MPESYWVGSSLIPSIDSSYSPADREHATHSYSLCRLSDVWRPYGSTAKYRVSSKPGVASKLRKSLVCIPVWSSGQDKAHAITRNLQLYGPGIKIWIDVDSLQDIDRLEDDIVESAVVLIFYTTGYFQSVNCRREFLSSDSA